MDTAATKRLIGTISKTDVIEAYNREMVKRDMVSSLTNYIGSIDKFRQIEVMEGQMMSEMEIPGGFVNRTLQELNLRNRFGVGVILIKQGYDKEKNQQQNVIPPAPDYRFQLGDTILVLGSASALEKIKHYHPE